MKNQRFAALCLCGFILSVFAPALAQARPKLAQHRHRRPVGFWTNKKAVVQVLHVFFVPVTDANGNITLQVAQGLGTGAVVDKNGWVITNNHVVASPPKKEDKTTNQSINPPPPALPEIYMICTVKKGVRDCDSAELIATDVKKDLALLHTNRRFPSAVQFASNKNLWPGDDVYLWGNITSLLPPSPLFGNYVGRLSLPYFDGGNFPEMLPLLLHDINISYGSSGGPMFDETGRCIGLAVAFMPSAVIGGRSLGIAIPSTTVVEFYKKNRPKPIK